MEMTTWIVYNENTNDVVGYWFHGVFYYPNEYEALFKKEK